MRNPYPSRCAGCGRYWAVEGHAPYCRDAGVLRRQADAAIATDRSGELTPMGGASVRAAFEHDTAQRLKHRPAAHQYRAEIVGCEMAAAALTDAALSDPDVLSGR